MDTLNTRRGGRQAGGTRERKTAETMRKKERRRDMEKKMEDEGEEKIGNEGKNVGASGTYER